MKNTIREKIAMLESLEDLINYIDSDIKNCKEYIEIEYMTEVNEAKMKAFEKIKAHLEKLI